MAPLSSHHKRLAALLFLVLLTFSFLKVTESPPFGFDEGWVVQVATNIAHLGVDGLQFSPGSIEHVSVLTSVGYPLTYTLALWFKIFGSGVLQARIMMAIWMILFAAVTFILARRLFGNALALASVALLVTFPPFYAFGKNVIGEVPVQFFLVLFLLFFHLAAHNTRRKTFWLVMCGLSAGLCVVTKTMALAFAPILVIGALIARKRGLASWKDIGTVVSFSIVPVVVWIAANFQAGDTLSSVLDYYTNPAALYDKATTFRLNLMMLFTGIGPLFTLFLMAGWITGVLLRLKDKVGIYVEEIMSLLFSLLVLTSFLFRYGDVRYLFPVQALAILFAPYSYHYIWSRMPIKLVAVTRKKLFYSGIAALALTGLYQLSFSSFVADSYKSTYIHELTEYFSSVPASTSVFFYNAPHVVPLFRGNNYYQRIVMFEKWVLGSEFAPIVKEGSVEMLVLNPHMSKADQKLPLDKYAIVAQFRKIIVMKKKE